MLRFGRKQQNSAKAIILQLKNKKKKKNNVIQEWKKQIIYLKKERIDDVTAQLQTSKSFLSYLEEIPTINHV